MLYVIPDTLFKLNAILYVIPDTLLKVSLNTTKTGRHDIAEILLKVALNTKIQIHSETTWCIEMFLARSITKLIPVFCHQVSTGILLSIDQKVI
jgi:hypothetical protein